MNQLLLASLLVLPAQTPQSGTAGAAQHSGRTTTQAASIEGSWTLVFGERQGHQMKATNVTIHNDMLSFSMDGQQHNWRLEFGPRQTLRAWHQGEGPQTSGATGATGTTSTAGNRGAMAGAHRGVYILSGDYLCLSVERNTAAMREGVGPAGAASNPANVGQATAPSDVLGQGNTATGRPGASGAGTAARTGTIGSPHQNQFFVMILQHQSGATSGHSNR